MAKKKTKDEARPTLKKMLEHMGFGEEELILIHIYSKQTTTEPVCVGDVGKTLLKKKIMTVMPKHGGSDYNHSLFMFVVE